MKFDKGAFFENHSRKIQVLLKPDKNNRGTLHEDLHTFMIIAQFYLEWEMFQKKVLEKIKTHFNFNILFEYRAVYEIMWENVVGPDRPQMTM
jgi:hypothetical protein